MVDSPKNNLISNFSALTLMQMIQYLAPLIVLPYLVRVIGPAKFGIISLAQAIAYYFALLPDLGMNLYAPREVALIKRDRQEIASFVGGVLVLKASMLALVLIAYGVMIFLVPQFNAEIWVFLFSAGYIIGESFIPVWFFQGIEKMGYITIGVFVIRLLSLVSIFIFITSETDYIYVPLINGSALVAGVLFMYALMFFREGVRVRCPIGRNLRKTLREAMPLFASNLVNNLYTGMNVIVLGLFTSNTVVGYYAAAERLVKVGMGLITQLSNVFYPHVSRMLNVSLEEGVASMRTGFSSGMTMLVPASIFTIFYAGPIVQYMLGTDFLGSVPSLKILGTLFIVAGLGNILGMQVLLPLGERRIYMWSMLAGAATQLVLVFFFVHWLQEVGAALAFVLAQAVVAFWIITGIWRRSLRIVEEPFALKLAGLILGLCLFCTLSWLMGNVSWVSMLLFVPLSIVLVFFLKIIDVKAWSINTSS